MAKQRKPLIINHYRRFFFVPPPAFRAKIQAFYQRMERAMERLRVLMNEYRPVLNGERFLTDAELSERLKLSRRTLQECRSNGKITYYQIGTKILYKESDIEKLLNDNR